MSAKKLLFITFLLSSLAATASGQILRKYSMIQSDEPEEGLASNVITDIVVFDDTVWFGTGRGLSRTRNEGLSFESFGADQGIGRGGMSGLAVSADVVWVATGFDSTTEFGTFQAGGGLAYTTDDGETWDFVPQPGETPVQNITFDVALQGDEVWITSFGGGLRKSNDLGQQWEIVTPDSFIFDPVGRLNHRAFSVHVADSVLWVGTAGGINRSTDGGATWTNFSHQNQPFPISGNFVVAIANQKYAGRDVIWAGTRETTVESQDDSEFRGISWSEDQGFTWRTALNGETIHNIAFDDSAVYAGSDKGLWKSIDGGETWALFPAIVGINNIVRVFSNRVFDADVSAGHLLWAGTGNGLAKTSDNGLTWQVFQVFEPAGRDGNPRTYAFPNPFSPGIHNRLDGIGHVRFQYNTLNATSVTLKIYDFSMQHVVTVVENVARPANRDLFEVWDGRGANGFQVANGVYFYRLDLSGDGEYWGKIVVLN